MACVVILAGHRTGSSMLSGVVHRLGFPAALSDNDLMPAAPMNPKGFYEDLKFYELHKRMLGFDERREDLWRNPWPQQQLQQPTLIEDYRAHVKARAAAHANWSVKDPRLCFLFPVLRRVLRELGIGYKVLSLHRPIDQVASSMTKRSMTRDLCESLRAASLHEGARRVLEIDLLQNEPNCVLPVLSDKLATARTSHATVVEIAKFLSVKPTQEALDFPQEELRNFRSTP